MDQAGPKTNVPFASVPPDVKRSLWNAWRQGKGRLWGLLKTTKWPQKLDYNRRANKDKNGSRRQWMRKDQTPPKSEPKTTKNARNQKQKTGETLPTEPSKDKKKIASSTTNLQAAGNMSQNKLGLQKTSELVETPKRHLWITLWKR